MQVLVHDPRIFNSDYKNTNSTGSKVTFLLDADPIQEDLETLTTSM